MVAIRNNNTNVPHVFRYPKYETNIFYPAGSLVSYPVLGADSDQPKFDFYVSRVDVPAAKNIDPPNDTFAWKVVMTTSLEDISDSELVLDSELKQVYHDYRAEDSDLKVHYDSEIAKVRHDFQAKDSDLEFEHDSDIRQMSHDMKAFDSDLLIDLTRGYDYGVTF